MKPVSAFLTQFRDGEDGSIAIELLLVVPILVWALMSTLVFFDIFRAEAISNRAALTVADMVSREEQAITPPYLLGMRELLRVLAERDDDPDFRLTYFTYDEPNDQYLRIWSRNEGMGSDYNSAQLNALRDQLPIMTHDDRAFLLETRMLYRAPFEVGIGPFVTTNLDGREFENFTVISPRFIRRICFDADPNDDTSPLECDPDGT